jgi:hypothetical protein
MTSIFKLCMLFFFMLLGFSFITLSDNPKKDGSSTKQAIEVNSIAQEYYIMQSKNLNPYLQVLIFEEGNCYDVFYFKDSLNKPIYFKLIKNDNTRNSYYKMDTLIEN